MEGSSTDRRVDDLGREVFERAVTIAATQATQNVAQIHRRRLVSQAALAAFFVSLAIALLVSWFLYQSQRATVVANAQSNCALVKELSAPLADFVASDASLRRAQLQVVIRDQKLTGAYRRLFGASEYDRLIRRSEEEDSATVTYWLKSVVPRLVQVASADCASRLK